MTEQEEVKIEALKFIKKYNKKDNREINLLSLCVIADKYDNTYVYQRQIYNDFSLLSVETQDKVLEMMGVDFEIKEDDFWKNTLKKLEEILKEWYHQNPNFFSEYYYEDAKYLEKALTNYGNEKVPQYFLGTKKSLLGAVPYTLFDAITDILAKIDYEIELTNGIKFIPSKYKFETIFTIATEDGDALNGKEIIMCYVECLIAMYSSIYNYNNKEEPDDNEINLGYIDDYFNDENKTMEDLFLETLLYINVY